MTENIRLNSSKLGTKEYWDDFYDRELKNFHSNEKDTGECWFDDSNAEAKMVQYLVDKIESRSNSAEQGTLRFVDLGTGNGHLLFELYETLEESRDVLPNFKYHFAGIDYSEKSVQFATSIASVKYPTCNFQFEKVDLLKKECDFLVREEGKFDFILDKGTLDAIALNQSPLEEFGGQTGLDVYTCQAIKLMHQHSIMLVTSCNFTESELTQIITHGSQNRLKLLEKVEYPSFKFGGVSGSTICTLAFVKC